MNKILLIDGKYFLYRSLTAKFILTHNDIVTNSYYNILASIKSIYKKLSIDNCIILWDDSYSYRREIYPEYKMKKYIADDNIIKQKSIIDQEYENVQTVLKEIGFASYKKLGLEADDLFALYCQQFTKNNKIYLATKDEDLYQCLYNNDIIIYDPKLKIQKTRQWFIKEYGIIPDKWSTVKALAGCQSDNIKGIEGIGEKTAIKWIRQELNKSSIAYKKISDNLFDLRKFNFNIKLVELPFKQIKLLDKQTKFNIENFIYYCQLFGFKSFLKELDTWKEVFK